MRILVISSAAPRAAPGAEGTTPFPILGPVSRLQERSIAAARAWALHDPWALHYRIIRRSHITLSPYMILWSYTILWWYFFSSGVRDHCSSDPT